MFQDEANINQALVGDGWWFSKFVPKDAVLKQLKQEAKGAEKGLWADPNSVPPWLYRRLDGGAFP